MALYQNDFCFEREKKSFVGCDARLKNVWQYFESIDPIKKKRDFLFILFRIPRFLGIEEFVSGRSPVIRIKLVTAYLQVH